MKRKWLSVILASAVVISGFYLYSSKNDKENVSEVPALSFLKNDKSKTTAYHYRKWKEVKSAFGENSKKTIEYKRKHDEPLTKLKNSEKDETLTLLIYNYFHDENIYLMDSSDKLFTSLEKKELKSGFDGWKKGEISTADLTQKWEKLFSTNSNGLHFEKPIILKREVERKETAFEQLQVMEQTIQSKITTTTPALFYVEMMYDDSKDVYTLYYVSVSQK